MSEWISCADTLPEKEGMYLCTFSDGDIETFHYDGIETFWGVHNVYVTHWQPIPPPPETKEEIEM